MKTRDLFFDLPPELIAQHPPEQRGESRLLVVDRRDDAPPAGLANIHHSHIRDIADYIHPGSVMVFNDSRVRRARIYGTDTASGVTQEFLLIAPRTEERTRWLVIGPRSKKLRPGRLFQLEDHETIAEVTTGAEREPPYREITTSRPITEAWLQRYGHIPLPPYIQREDAPEDAERYQTVYARTIGSVAAPTAGLHFTEEILETLRERGVTICFVTLHVGIGTFFPVRTAELEDHTMHREEYSITETTAATINQAKREGRPVCAVGTTAVRTLESAALPSPEQGVRSGGNATEIFIYPGYRFQVVDQLFTNFHTPESTLLALVSAFADTETIRHAYQEAVSQRYRFFSYGDAMLIR